MKAARLLSMFYVHGNHQLPRKGKRGPGRGRHFCRAPQFRGRQSWDLSHDSGTASLFKLGVP